MNGSDEWMRQAIGATRSLGVALPSSNGPSYRGDKNSSTCNAETNAATRHRPLSLHALLYIGQPYVTAVAKKVFAAIILRLALMPHQHIIMKQINNYLWTYGSVSMTLCWCNAKICLSLNGGLWVKFLLKRIVANMASKHFYLWTFVIKIKKI